MKAPKTQGYYYFEDGYYCWVHGMGKEDLAIEIRKHGRLIKFVRT